MKTVAGLVELNLRRTNIRQSNTNEEKGLTTTVSATAGARFVAGEPSPQKGMASAAAMPGTAIAAHTAATASFAVSNLILVSFSSVFAGVGAGPPDAVHPNARISIPNIPISVNYAFTPETAPHSII